MIKKRFTQIKSFSLIAAVVLFVGSISILGFNYYRNGRVLSELINSAPTLSGGPANQQEIPVKLMVVIYDPLIESQGNRKLHEVLNWNNPDSLTTQFITDIKNSSHNNVNYQITQRIERDEWPLHKNGQRYTDELYLQQTLAHQWTLGEGDYYAMIQENDIVKKINSGEVDEVMFWGFPGAGWWESAMAGQGAYWINGGTYSDVPTKAFVMLGLNYERGPAEALESYGHRTENIIKRVYGSWAASDTHYWNKFTLQDRDLPGKGGIGNAHNAFNSRVGYDYDRNSTNNVPTSADDWYNFPNMTGTRTYKTCSAWNCDAHGYLKWWYNHMPHMTGLHEGKLNNWWRYIVDVEQFKGRTAFTPDPTEEFTENNSVDWSCAAAGASCTLSDSTMNNKSGNSSLAFTTDGAFDTWMKYPAVGGKNLDISDKKYFSFWANSTNSNIGYQNGSPTIYLRNDNGSYFKYQPSDEVLNKTNASWTKFDVPLSGDSFWIQTQSGTPTFTDIDQIEIHTDTWGSGFTVQWDGMGFSGDQFIDSTPPEVLITSPTEGSNSNSSGIIVNVNAKDNNAIFRLDLFVDGKYLESDALSPYIFSVPASTLPSGTHNITVVGYDQNGNKSTPSNITVQGLTVVTATPVPTPLPTISATPIVSPPPTPIITPNSSAAPAPLTFKGILPSNITTTLATIKWTTSGPGTTQVAYGTSSTQLDKYSIEDSTLTQSHVASLAGLVNNTKYFYKVISKNGSGKTFQSTVNSFKTKTR
jgi:hypothetical protein